MRETRVLWRIASLFGLMLAAPLAQSAPKSVKLDVVMLDYRFKPDRLTFQRGVRYQLHLENKGTKTHEFTAPIFFASAAIENPDILDNRRSELTLEPGESRDLFLTPRKRGKYDLRCADHDWNGMVGGITVK